MNCLKVETITAKQPSRGNEKVTGKYTTTTFKGDYNKVVNKNYGDHTSARTLPCKFSDYSQLMIKKLHISINSHISIAVMTTVWFFMLGH